MSKNINHHKPYEVVVIGAGLMGSAAARYLSQEAERVLILGPAEPENLLTHDGVFASHYDQGRLTRLIGKDVTWAHLAKYAMANYRHIEEQSGIPFYNPVGLVVASKPDGENRYMQNPLETAATIGANYTFYPAEDKRWQATLPYITFPDGFTLLHEHAPAGYINPRHMVQAQLTCAQQNGATLRRDTAVSVSQTADLVTIQTATGQTITAAKILVASGAFTNFNHLLPQPIPLKLKTETIVLGEVTAATATQLTDMPTVIYQIEDPDISGIYMAPPLRYPNGRYYIKMGCDTRTDTYPTTLKEVQDWFRHGDSATCRPAMARALQAQLPAVSFQNITDHRCVVCYTPNGYPTIDQIDEHIYVATGGNGSGAKGSDTIGRLAAGLILGHKWLPHIEKELFKQKQTVYK